MDEVHKLDELGHPASILWRGIEVKLLKEQLGDELARPGEALDLGCGEGVVAGAIWDRPLVVGLDKDEGMVVRARESGRYRWVVQGDARQLPVVDNSLDLVFSNSVLEHIERVEEVLAEVTRGLKPGGRFIFTVPSANLTGYSRWGGRLLFKSRYGRWRDKKYRHWHLYRGREWEGRLKAVGMRKAVEYYYLTEKEVEKWDELLGVMTLSRLGGRRGQRWVYERFYKNAVERMIREAKVTDERGAGLGMMYVKGAR